MIELRDRTMMVIGYGVIGTQVAERAKAFGMKVIAIDPKDLPISQTLDRSGKPDELDELLPLADVIVSCVPHTPQTEKMLGPAQFAAMKSGTYLIHVSRDEIVDTDALVKALREKRLAGAGLDVPDPEPLPADHPLWKMPNVVITHTPHGCQTDDRTGKRPDFIPSGPHCPRSPAENPGQFGERPLTSRFARPWARQGPPRDRPPPRINDLPRPPPCGVLPVMRTYPSLLRVLGAAVAGTFLLAGCKPKSAQAEKTTDGLTKIKVGYIGLTCEAPLYVAMEKGYFKEQGLDAELVKCEWGQFKDLVGLGSIHVVHQPIMAFLKPIEEGLDVKLTAGIHRGCLRVQTPLGSNLKTVKDLKGKRIGVPGMGTPPFIFANRVLGDNGIDPRNDVQWKVFPSSELGLALEKGEVDAIANSEPIGLLLLADKKVQNIVDQTTDEPYASEYCCGVIVNGKYAEANPEAIAAVTKAIMKGAKWVETNPRAAAIMSVEKKYIASNPELNADAIGRLRYIPSIAGGKIAIRGAAEGMIRAGILKSDMNIDNAIKKIYREYPGVTDEWLKSQEIEHVAMGQIQPNQGELVQQELATIGSPLEIKTCCNASNKATAATTTP